MPTENRSSNTEMVSVPPYIGLEPLVGRYYPAQCRRCGWVGSSEELTEDDAQCTRDIGDRLCLGDCDELERHDLLNIIQAMAAPQPHPEPIAWMVGTAIWWTKEEAERDAAATGLPIVGLGPMAGVALAEQHQAEPVINAEQVLGAYQFASFGPANHLRGTTNWCAAFAQELNHRIGADTTEVERIGKELREVREERDDLRRRVDDFQSRSHGIKNLSVVEQLNDKLAEALRVASQAHMALIGYLPAHRNDITTAAIAACAALERQP
ncbi:hypothetical protein ACOKS3_17600 [Pseudomonas sp. HS6-2]|uniref:hypothetical protein n=1 Tax=Pseudomonas sp. HS6-2 TaxID=3410986 RepID=UPI003BE0C957